MRILDNYVEGGASFSVSTSEHRITVPAGKRWSLNSGHVGRDVSATLTISVCTSADKIIQYLGFYSAAAADASYPQTTAAVAQVNLPQNVPLRAGDYIRFVFGAGQSTAAAISAIVEEVIA